MTRRVTAALLALVLLFTLLPVNTQAKIYRVNEEVALRKTNPMGISIDPNNEKTSYPIPYGCYWEKKRVDGKLVEGCYLPEHPSHANCEVNPNTGKPTCGLDAHTHSPKNCRYSQGWVWVVVRDEGYEGWDYDPEEPANYEFSVCCIDATGANPFAGVGFALTRPATEEEKTATGNDRTSVLVDSRNLKTNAKGFAYFDGTCKDTEAAGEATWTLVQSNTQWTDTVYRPHSKAWEVNVTVHGDGTYTVKDIREADAEEEPVSPTADYDVPPPEQGYNKDLKRLVMIHEPVRVNLYINAYNVPRKVESFQVSVSGMDAPITMQNVAGKGWQYVIENLEPGTYSITVQDAENYPSVTYKAGYNENAIEDNKQELTLGAGASNGLYQIHFANQSNNVKLYSVYDDADATPVGRGVRYGLFLNGAEEPVATLGADENAEDTEVVLTNENYSALWEEYGTEGEPLVFTIKQTQVPDDQHTLSEDTFTLSITKAPEGAASPFIVEVPESEQYGENWEPIATFVNAKPDMSHIVMMRTYDDGETPKLLSGVSYSLTENGEEIELENPSEIDFSTFAASEKREFLLEQKLAPGGHDKAEEKYKITLQWENEKPIVEVTREQSVVARIAAFFSGDSVERDNFGRWIVNFTSKETVEPDDTVRPDNMSNIVEIYSVDNDHRAITTGSFKYGLYRDTYENGEVPAVEFAAGSSGMIRITNDDWEDLALNNRDLASNEDISNLLNGGTIEVKLKQSNGAPYYENANEEYVLTLRLEGGSPVVELSVAKGSEPIRYNYETGAQKVTFVHLRADLSHCVSVRAYDADSGDSISGGAYRISKDGTEVDRCTEADIYAFGNYAPGEYILEQTVAPGGYSVPENQVTYKITVSEEQTVVVTREQSGLAALFSDKTVEQDAFGRWQARFENPRTQYAQVQLNLEDPQITWEEGCHQDNESLENQNYTFKLFAKDQTGAMQQQGEPLTLGKDIKVGTFNTELPVGTGFEIRLDQDDPVYDMVFSGDGTQEAGTKVYRGDAKKSGANEVSAKPVYDIKAGSYTPGLQLTKVDAADTGVVLEGAVFRLVGDTESYTTDKDGIISLSDKIQQPGLYYLEEVEAPEEYVKLEDPILIQVGYAYRNQDGITKQHLQAAAHLDDYVFGQDGVFIIKNAKNTQPDMPDAEIRLTLEDIEIKWNGCEDDTGKRSEFATRDYKFILSTLNEKDEWVDDPHELTLSGGATTKAGVFRTKLPVGTTYKIRAAGDDNLFDVLFTNAKTGATGNTVYMGRVESADGEDLKAKPRYELLPGDTDPGLYMVKVNARDTTKTLAGAEFVLKDEDGGVIAEFVTKRDGEIIIGNQYQFERYPSKYTLKEVTAPDDYVKLKGVIEITVDYQYTAVKENGRILARQDLEIRPYHKDVVLASDGSYYIKNVHESDLPQTGDAFKPLLWGGLLTVSAAALAVLLIGGKRRHRAQ